MDTQMQPDTFQITRRQALAAGVITGASALGLPRRWFRSAYESPAPVENAAWPMGQHDPAGTGHTEDSVTIQTRNQPAWSAKIDDPVLGIVAGGEQLFFTTNRSVGAIARSDGTINWHVSQFNPIPWRNESLSFAIEPTYLGDQLLVAESDSIVALNPENGTTLWEFETDETITSMLALGNTVYCEATLENEQVTVALDASSGFERFRVPTERAIHPQVSSGDLLVGTAVDDPRTVRALDSKSGNTRWTQTLDVPQQSAALVGTGGPCIVEGTVIFGGQTVQAVSLEGGATRWTQQLDVTNDGRFAVVSNGEMVHVFALEADLIAGLTLSDGDDLWTMSKLGLADWNPALTADVLYVGVDDGMYSVAPKSGLAALPKISAFTAMWSPIAVDGVLYAVRDDGVVKLKGQ